MKRILSTTLAAVALSIAMVSTVDARVMGVVQRSQQAAKANAQDIVTSTKALADARNAQQRDAVSQEVLDIVAQNPAQWELMQLELRLEQKQNQIKATSNSIRLRGSKLSWYNFTDKEYNDLQALLKTQKSDLAQIKKEITAQKASMNPEEVKAVSNATLGLIAAGGVVVAGAIAAAADEYFAGGKYRGMAMEKGRQAWEATAPYRTKVRGAVDAGVAGVGRAYRRARGIAEPVEKEVEEVVEMEDEIVEMDEAPVSREREFVEAGVYGQ